MTKELDNDCLRAKMVYSKYAPHPWYNPRRWYEEICQRLFRLDSRMARIVTSRKDRGVFDHMEILYHGIPSKEGIFGGKLDEISMRSRGGRSIRNRTNKAVDLIYKYAKIIAKNNGGNITLLSLGCGSAREVIGPLYKLKADRISGAHATCVDLDSKAIEYSSILAEEAGVLENVTYKRDDVLKVRRFSDEDEHPPRYDLISAVGMCEYFSNEQNGIWFNHVNCRLKPGGYLITTNMRSHDRLIMWAMKAIGWRLVYKEPKDFIEIVRKSGLNIVEVLHEPDTELHTFIVGKKSL